MLADSDEPGAASSTETTISSAAPLLSTTGSGALRASGAETASSLFAVPIVPSSAGSFSLSSETGAPSEVPSVLLVSLLSSFSVPSVFDSTGNVSSVSPVAGSTSVGSSTEATSFVAPVGASAARAPDGSNDTSMTMSIITLIIFLHLRINSPFLSLQDLFNDVIYYGDPRQNCLVQYYF